MGRADPGGRGRGHATPCRKADHQPAGSRRRFLARKPEVVEPVRAMIRDKAAGVYRLAACDSSARPDRSADGVVSPHLIIVGEATPDARGRRPGRSTSESTGRGSSSSNPPRTCPTWNRQRRLTGRSRHSWRPRSPPASNRDHSGAPRHGSTQERGGAWGTHAHLPSPEARGSGSFNKRLVARRRRRTGCRRRGDADRPPDYPLPLYDGDLEETDGLPAHARKLKDLLPGKPGVADLGAGA